MLLLVTFLSLCDVVDYVLEVSFLLLVEQLMQVLVLFEASHFLEQVVDLLLGLLLLFEEFEVVLGGLRGRDYVLSRRILMS